MRLAPRFAGVRVGSRPAIRDAGRAPAARGPVSLPARTPIPPAIAPTLETIGWSHMDGSRAHVSLDRLVQRAGPAPPRESERAQAIVRMIGQRDVPADLPH